MNDSDKRAEYTRGLRALADLLDANPDLQVPWDGSHPDFAALSVITLGDEGAAQVAAWAGALPGMKKKKVQNTHFYLTGSLHGLHLRVIVDRDQVCRRVVTGTREVTEQVPDPEALAAVPTVTVTKTVEDVEWVCEPILSEQVAS